MKTYEARLFAICVTWGNKRKHKISSKVCGETLTLYMIHKGDYVTCGFILVNNRDYIPMGTLVVF